MAMAVFLSLLYVSVGIVSALPHPDKIIKLPGQPQVGFQLFSGYVTVDDKKQRYLFYYFVEAETDPASKPLVLWLNGGPGCSSVGVGAFSENGPFRPRGQVLVKNEHSWNKEANMLYLESPIGVGFSYSANTSSYKTVNDEVTARDNVVFLLRWFHKFPQYSKSNLFLTGESYAGHYVPQLAKLMMAFNKKEKLFNLKGVALGNPVLEFATDFNSRAEYFWSHGLISDPTYRMFSSACNYSRYVSEYYRDSVSPICSRVMSLVSRETSKFVDKYDVTLDVCISSVLSQSKIISPHENAEKLDVCVEDEVVNYLNRKDVRRVLHAELVGVHRWAVCSSILDYQLLDIEIPTISIIGMLVKERIPVLIYSGDQDSVVPLIGSRQTVHQLARQMRLNTTVPYRVWFAGQQREEEKDFDLGSDEPEAPLPLTVTSRVLYMLGDITAGPAYRFAQWLELVRKRSSKYRSSGFPRRADSMPLSAEESSLDQVDSLPSEQTTEVSLWERLGKAAVLDIESSTFSWNMLSSLHHTEHNSSTEQSEDDPNKPLEVTVNSGGVVFFALFNEPENDDASPKEAAAVIKISSSRMATQSERMGYEFAKWLGVQTPQARVIHNCSPEWLHIKEGAEKAKEAAISEGDEIVEMTCSELVEALELSRCLTLMNYIHGSPLLESSNAFDSREAGERTAAALGRVLMLDLVIRNEDRLPCRHLRWRGNPANLLLADKVNSANLDSLAAAFDSAIDRYRPRVIRALQKERRANSVDSRISTPNPGLISQSSDPSDITESPKSCNLNASQTSNESTCPYFHIVAIDSGVPRRPPAGKRAGDQENYPKLVELLINSPEYASKLLYEITGGKLGSSPEASDAMNNNQAADLASIGHEFRIGFRAALHDLQGFHIFLLTLHQKLDSVFRVFLGVINRASAGDLEKEDIVIPESPSQSAGFVGHCPSTPSKERAPSDTYLDSNESECQRIAPRPSSSGCRDSLDSMVSPNSRDSQGKCYKGSGEPLSSVRFTSKLRDFHKFAKVDAELNKELEQWNEMLKSDAIKLCQENNFNTGFFEGSDSNYVVDAYELKVRLEHILERISLISDAANTEKPSAISRSLFIGGALAARSVYTLQHLGITHILCLCANETGQSDSQFPDLFEYKNFSICDDEDSNISALFEEAHDFIDHVEENGGKVLVHCFEGRSRSATVVLAYLMLRKKFTLLKAWNTLRRVHRRAHPNDGFAKILLDLDRKLHGKVSMEWQQRKPSMKVCPICGKNAGLSSSSLKLHLQKAHKKLSSGSVDSAMNMEIQKALDALKIRRGGSVSPTQRQSSMIEELES